ncbi:hypothetical protein D9619_008576 [Psilocybe cf. subviscida]|uniref:FAD-binding domain-containing protein n=1 Tax=Psilocybe cf. subviscida TaxID=2480587 RepID=A0A8H5F178_9AGAR|nr:hypothetical protein D9619_008576 [Psilocybe cf. subviscida]
MGINTSKSVADNESHVDVLIIAAGPAGLMACNALARNGINVRIVDIRPSKILAGHADELQSRTLEVLKSYGLADKVFKEGAHMHMIINFNLGDGRLSTILVQMELTDRVPDITAPSARFPFEITLHQGEIETVFLDSMRGFGIEVDRPTSPLSMDILGADSGEYPVRTVVQHLDGSHRTETIYSKYVVGADAGLAGD